MTDLDPDTKARIEAEERYRAELRARETAQSAPAATAHAPSVPTKPAKRGGCGKWVLYGIGIFIALGVLGQLMGGTDSTPSRSTESATTATTVPDPETTSRDQPIDSAGTASDEGGVNDAVDPNGDEVVGAVDPNGDGVVDPPRQAGDGEVQADGSVNVGVWNISGVTWSKMQNIGGEFGQTAGEGESFVTVKYTLKNNTNETQNFSSMWDQPKLILADGALIDSDTMLSIQSSDQQIDGQIAPGLKRTGSYAFRVPSDRMSGMKFQLQFFNGKAVDFPLGE